MLTLIPGLPDLDLVLLDASMPGMENFAGLRRLVENVPDAPVVVTSPSESSTQIVAAIRGGARGYFSPSTKACVIRHALQLVLSGEIYVPACALRLDHGKGMLRPEGLVAWMGNAGGKLTPRQCEIVAMLGEGKSNKEIAREAKVLEGTIKLHVRGILRKLGVRNRTEAVLAAARGGYLSNGALGTEAPLSERTAADAGHKISKSGERKRYVLKKVVRLCVGWCFLSASFELCVKPLPERDHIKWGIITTGGVLVCNKALSPSTCRSARQYPASSSSVNGTGWTTRLPVVGDQLERKSGLLT